MARGLESREQRSMPQTIDAEIETTSTMDRLRFLGKRAAVIGSLVLGAAVLSPAVAHADEPTCYGDYCSGQYPDVTHCDEDAKTLAATILNKSGGSVNVGVGDVGFSSGGDTDEYGVVELRWSERCGTAWTRLRTNRASDVTYVGIEKSDGYTQQVDPTGAWIGMEAGNVFTPMIYSRDPAQDFRAYVFSQAVTDPTPDNYGTYWVNSQDVAQY